MQKRPSIKIKYEYESVTPKPTQPPKEKEKTSHFSYISLNKFDRSCTLHAVCCKMFSSILIFDLAFRLFRRLAG
jgi:hypothetical protein